MSDMLTFGDCKASHELAQVSGVCSDSDAFRSMLDKAVRKLMQRGNFWSTVRKLQGCVWGNCITWNRRVGTVLAVDTCCGPVVLKNHWDCFMPIDGNEIHRYLRGQCGRLTMVDGNTSPVFNQIQCSNGVYLRFYPSLITDVGKTITYFGTDGNGQQVRSLRGGIWQDGITLTLASPYVQSAALVRHVDRILKQVTDGPVHGYQVEPLTPDNLLELAHYEAGETRPNYRTSKIHGWRGCNGSQRIDALVKLEFVPVVNDDDLVGIDNMDALCYAFQSIRDQEAGDVGKAQADFALAIRELNMELRNKMPDGQIPINISTQGTAHLSKQAIGYMT